MNRARVEWVGDKKDKKRDLPSWGGEALLDCLGDFDSPRESPVEAIDDVNQNPQGPLSSTHYF